MTEPPPTPDPRAELRDLIAAVVHRVDCGCQMPNVHTPDSRSFYGEIADRVVGLFDLIELQRTDRGHCYVARTKEETP